MRRDEVEILAAAAAHASPTAHRCRLDVMADDLARGVDDRAYNRAWHATSERNYRATRRAALDERTIPPAANGLAAIDKTELRKWK